MAEHEDAKPEKDEAVGQGRSETGPESPAPPKTAQNIRMAVLFGILLLAVLALGYEYLVARPGVENAHAKIMALNTEINQGPTAKIMTSQDVQQTLGRQPTRSYNEGIYTVEVYSWTSGIPFRTHDYFAIYTPDAGQLLFKTHFPFEIPVNELAPPDVRPDTEGLTDSPELASQSRGGGGGEGGEAQKKRSGGRRGGGAGAPAISLPPEDDYEYIPPEAESQPPAEDDEPETTTGGEQAAPAEGEEETSEEAPAEQSDPPASGSESATEPPGTVEQPPASQG